MKRSLSNSMLIAVVSFLIIALPGCTGALGITRVPDAGELNFDNIVTYAGAGDWIIDKSGDTPVITQGSGDGFTWLIFQDIDVPETFLFEAELGVISRKDHLRPDFGLIINQPLDQLSREFPSGYWFSYRKGTHSAHRYEIIKRAQSQPTSTPLAGHEPGGRWEPDLTEWHTLRIERDGDNLNAYVDDVFIMNAVDADYVGGTIGFWTNGSTAVFRNIRYEGQ